MLVAIGIAVSMDQATAQPSPTPLPPTLLPPGARSRLPAAGLIVTHAQSRCRLPNTGANAVVRIEVHGRNLRTTAAALARQSQMLLTFLRSQPTERLRTDGTNFDPEIQELRSQLLAGCVDNGATSLGQFGATPREQEIEAARREMVGEAGESALAQAHAITASVGQRIVGVELVGVDPLTRLDPGTAVYTPLVADRASRPAPPTRPIASEAGDSALSVTVMMTLRLASPE